MLRRSCPFWRSCPFGGIAQIDEDPPTTDSSNFHSEVHWLAMNSLTLNVSLVISFVGFWLFHALIHYDSLLSLISFA